jgi:cell division protein YceG involved in septum cleavage
MPDRLRRSEREREAARVERERERAERASWGDEATHGSAADAPPLAEYEAEYEYEYEYEAEYDGDTDELDSAAPPPERPSGTRRVSRIERSGSKRHRAPRPARTQRHRAPRPARTARAPRGRRRRWVGRVASVVALTLGVAVIWFLVALFQPFHGSPHGRVTVKIPAGSSSSEIGDRLARDGVIPSGFLFKLRASLAGQRAELRSGTYHLQLGMTYGAVLTALTKVPPAVPESELTITEGRTRGQIAQLLHEQHIRGNYLAATRSSPLLDLRRYGLRHRPSSLEGFLFPDTFKLVDPIRVSALVDDQLVDFKRRFAQVKLGYAASRHLTAYDVLKVASLVEAEAASPSSRPLVASPPTPIDNPGMSAIQAAAHPASSGYLFFFAKPCSTATEFATSYSQFLHLLSVDRRPHC